MKQSRSIRSDVFILIVLISFVPLAVFFLFDVLSLTRELKRDVHKSYVDIAGHFGKDLTLFLADRVIDLRLLSQNPVLKSPKADPIEKKAEMSKVQDYYHYFNDITLLNPDGTAVLSTTYSFYSDLSKTRWFLEAKKGNTVITDPYRSLSGNALMISFFLPIIDRGKIVSVLSARMNMEKIWESSDTVKLGEFGYIVLVDQFDNIIAHPDRSLIFKKFPGLPRETILTEDITTMSIDYVDDDGIEYVGSVVAVENSPLFKMKPIFIVAVQQKNEAYTLSHYVLIRDLLEMVAVLSLIILISLYISARMAHPIQTIIDAASEIAEGKFGTTINVKSWKEINSIADAFNMMSQGLLAYTTRLKISEERYRTLVEDINDGYYMIQDTTMIYTNDAALRIMGYERAEVIGKNIFDFIPQEHLREIIQHYTELMSGNYTRGKIEIPLIAKDGRTIYIEVQPKTVNMGDGELIAGTFVDVSARKKREELLTADRKYLENKVREKSRELFESEEKYRTIVESAADGIFLCEVGGSVISVNKAMIDILGFDPMGMDSRTFFERTIPWPEGKDAVDPDTKVPSNQETLSVNMSIDVEPRGTVNLDIKMNTIAIGKGNRFVQGVVRDTTERKTLETALINSKQRLQAAFDALSDRMYMVDSDYVLTFVNKYISQELSVHYRDILGKKCYSFFNTKAEPCVGCPLEPVKATAMGITDEVIVTDRHDTRFYRVTIYPIVPKPFSRDYLVYSRHITEEKAIQEHLIQSDRLISLGQLSAGVAHEINNPLTSILGYAEMLLDGKNEQDDDFSDLKIIERQALNCKTILNDLLLFSRNRLDKHEFFNINDVLDTVLLISHKEMKDKSIHLKKRFSKKLPVFYGDQIRITQVFLNIVKNAVDAVDEGGRIIATTEYDDTQDKIRVIIKDNGHGIDPNDINKIFDPFYTTKPPGKGTGLGLSVSYGIVAEHDGEIRAQSRPGKGATFIILLPASHRD